MTLFSCLSYGLIAYGPVTSLFFITLFPYAEQVLILLVCAFIWLLSILVSSLIWIVVPPLKSVPAFSLPFAVILQEVARYLTFLITSKLSNKFPNPESRYRHKLAYAAGTGFGFATGLFSFLNVLKSSYGPGVVGLRGEWSYPQFVLSSALLTCAFTLLHIPWSVILFDAFHRKKWLLMLVSPCTHLLLSSLTLLNSRITVWPSLIAAYSLLLPLALLAFYTAGGSLTRTLKICTEKKVPNHTHIQ